MVDIATHSKTRIVVGGNDICHLDIRTQPLGKCDATTYYHVSMVTAVCSIEAIIARQYLALDVCSNLLSNHSLLPHYHLNNLITLEVLTRKVAHLLGGNIGYRSHTLLRSAIICTTHDVLNRHVGNAEGAVEDA